MYKRPQNKILNIISICSGLIGALILLHIFVGRPVLKYAKKLKAEFGLKQAKLQDSEALVRSFPNPQKGMDEIEKKTEELKDKGVTPRQIPRLIQLLAQPAGKLNLNVISIKPREDMRLNNENLPAGVNKVYIEVTLSGSYQSIGEYIKALSELSVSFVVERLSIQKREENGLPLSVKKTPEKSEGKPQELLANLLVSSYTMWEI